MHHWVVRLAYYTCIWKLVYILNFGLGSGQSRVTGIMLQLLKACRARQGLAVLCRGPRSLGMSSCKERMLLSLLHSQAALLVLTAVAGFRMSGA